jgi:3-oxoacyl-[acyl-carrier protein] reductase
MVEGKVALVTAGGGYGIGLATSIALAAGGATVVVTDKSGERAHKAALSISNKGGKAFGRALDVTQSKDVDAVFSAVAEEIGPIDILVNNAGISVPTAVVDMSEELFDRVVNVSLRGTFLCTRKVLRGMIDRRFGRIVNVSSYVAFSGSPDLAHYAAAKAGIVGFTKATALEVGKYNITVNAVAPGIILNEHLEANRAQFSEDIRAHLEKGTPRGRPGQPEDVAEAIVFLAGSKGGFVTGVTLPVTGGQFII